MPRYMQCQSWLLGNLFKIASFASVPARVTYFLRKNSLSFSEGTFAAMILSNAVTKAGYSNESPENVGGSLTE